MLYMYTLLLFVGHVNLPECFAGLSNNIDETEDREAEDPREKKADVCLAKDDQHGVGQDEDQADFGGADAEVRDAKLVGRSKTQK